MFIDFVVIVAFLQFGVTEEKLECICAIRTPKRNIKYAAAQFGVPEEMLKDEFVQPGAPEEMVKDFRQISWSVSKVPLKRQRKKSNNLP